MVTENMLEPPGPAQNIGINIGIETSFCFFSNEAYAHIKQCVWKHETYFTLREVNTQNYKEIVPQQNNLKALCLKYNSIFNFKGLL